MPEENPYSECDIVYLHYVNEQNLGSCPQVKFLIGSRQHSVVLDTGCEASILSEQLYNELKANGVESLEMLTQNVVLVGAFSRKVHRVRKQVLLTLKFEDLHRSNMPRVRTVTNAHADWIQFLHCQWYKIFRGGS